MAQHGALPTCSLAGGEWPGTGVICTQWWPVLTACTGSNCKILAIPAVAVNAMLRIVLCFVFRHVNWRHIVWGLLIQGPVKRTTTVLYYHNLEFVDILFLFFLERILFLSLVWFSSCLPWLCSSGTLGGMSSPASAARSPPSSDIQVIEYIWLWGKGHTVHGHVGYKALEDSCHGAHVPKMI